MTLIAAFRCREGVVICADSQESAGHYRVSVDKILPLDVGEYQVAITGAGEHGALIDALLENLIDEIQEWPDDYGVKSMKRDLRIVLNDYYATEMKAWPWDEDETKRMDFIVCLRSKSTGAVMLWEVESNTIKSVRRGYSLIGWTEDLYKHEAQRLYQKNASALRCIMLGIHLLLKAEATSMYVKRPIQIIGIRDTSEQEDWDDPAVRKTKERLSRMVWIEDPKRVRELEERMMTFDGMVADLLLSCPDTTLQEKEFADRLEVFKQEVMRLRDEYKRAAMYSDWLALEQATAPEGIQALMSNPYYRGVIPAYRDRPGGESFTLKDGEPLRQVLDSLGKSDTQKPEE